MQHLESVPQETSQDKEDVPTLPLTNNIVQIAFAKQWFALHPEIAAKFDLAQEHPKVTNNDVLQTWIAHGEAKTYREYAERNAIEVDPTNLSEINAILSDMGILDTIR